MAATSVEMNEGRLRMRLACWLPMHCPSSKCTSRGVSERQQLHSNLPEALPDRPFKLSAEAKRVFVAYQIEKEAPCFRACATPRRRHTTRFPWCRASGMETIT